MCTQYDFEKISAYSIARVAYARTRARNGCRRPLRGIFPLRLRDDLALKTAALPFLGSRSWALSKQRRDTIGVGDGKRLWGCISGVRRMLCLEPEAARMVAARGEALHGALGRDYRMRTPLVMRIGSLVRDKGKRGGSMRQLATGAADGADEAEAARRVSAEWRMQAWSGMAPKTSQRARRQRVARPREGTAVAGAGHAGGRVHLAGDARRRRRREVSPAEDGRGVPGSDECDGDDGGARMGTRDARERRCARGPGVGEEESGAVPEMVVAGGWRGKQRMRWEMDAAGPNGVAYPAAVRRGSSLPRATRASRNDSAGVSVVGEGRRGQWAVWMVAMHVIHDAPAEPEGATDTTTNCPSPSISSSRVRVLALVETPAAVIDMPLPRSTLDFWQQFESIMLSQDDSRSLYIIGGQGGHGGHGHPHGTGGPGGTGLGPNVNIIEHQSNVYNLHPGPASQQAFQPSNIQASQTINNCPPPSRIFQGRRDILGKMHSFFTSDVRIQHIYVLYGLGGAGKTQITLKFINESSSRFSDTFFIDASTTTTIDTGLKNIAIVKGSGNSLQDGLQWLASRVEEWLLVFDNTDDPSIDLNDFIPQCNHGNIIITSRNPGLRVYGSHSLVSDMEEEDAVALLLKSAAQAVTTRHHANCNRNCKVYTTWQMSFDRLTQPAAMFLQGFTGTSGIPLTFSGAKWQWDSLQFSNMTNEVQAYSLISIDAENKLFSIHPLVHAWSQTTGNPEKYLSNMGSILGMALSARSRYDIQLGSLAICPHVELALQMDAEVALVFKERYGFILWEAGKYKQYEKLLEGVLEKQKQVLGDNHPDTLCTMGNLATTYSDLGEHQKAKELKATVLEKQEQVLGDNHPDTLETMGNLASTYSDLGEDQKAKELKAAVLEKRKQVLGDNHPDTLITMGNLANTHSDLGEHQKAKELKPYCAGETETGSG
ncbi:hypothetical protein DFH08DRAFT_942861 [Mycena albidolilacea]|uniref:Kinesin light chain n=1 Tax=Mycena albidolilacea TaxID=1033008 RepID=A0AAD7EDU6_9AGAR|nr:hypothetical protein DFH08DRAFT_942861 [Mycena albidolilacea]